MKWRVNQGIVNEERVFIYSLRKVIIESVVELNEEHLTKIYNIIKEERGNTGEIATRIVCEIRNPIRTAGCGYVGTLIKKTYVDINTRHDMYVIWKCMIHKRHSLFAMSFIFL